MPITLSHLAAGWVTFTIEHGAGTFVQRASHLSDCLAELMKAAILIHRGARDSRVVMEDEPGQVRLVFERDGEGVQVRCIRLPETYSHKKDADGKVEFEDWWAARGTVLSVFHAMAALLQTHGLEGYAAEWRTQSEFPQREFWELAGSLYPWLCEAGTSE